MYYSRTTGHGKLQVRLLSGVQRRMTSRSYSYFQQRETACEAAAVVTFHSKKGTKTKETDFIRHFKQHLSSQDEQQHYQLSPNNLNAHNLSKSIHTVFREKLSVEQVANKSQPLMEPEPPLPYSEEAASGIYSKPVKSSELYLGLASGLLQTHFLTKRTDFSPPHVSQPPRLVTLQEYQLRCHFHNTPVTSSLSLSYIKYSPQCPVV
jgi:hypothetical protein